MQIVREMQYLAFGQEGKTLGEYIDWAGAQLERFGGARLVVTGETAEEKATSFTQAMLDAGLATELKK